MKAGEATDDGPGLGESDHALIQAAIRTIDIGDVKRSVWPKNTVHKKNIKLKFISLLYIVRKRIN